MPRPRKWSREPVDPRNMRLIDHAARSLVKVARRSDLDPFFVAVAFRKAAEALSGGSPALPRGPREVDRPVYRVGVAEPGE